MTTVTLSLLLCSDHCQWVAAYLPRSKSHKAEEKQLGVTVVGRIAFRPAHDRLQ